MTGSAVRIHVKREAVPVNNGRWAEAVRRYYEAKNQIWLYGEGAVAETFRALAPHARLGVREAVLWRESLAPRSRRGLKSLTRIETRRVTAGAGTPGADRSRSGVARLYVDVTERVRLLYRTGEEVYEERRVYPWRLTLVQQGGMWRIAEERPLNDLDHRTATGDGVPDRPERFGGMSPAWWRERRRKLFSFRRFDRLQVFKYAELWWDGYNPRFRTFRSDCTNFVSQCLWYGGLSMEPAEEVERGWWYRWGREGQDRWSLSWAVSHSFYWYMMQLAQRGRVEPVARPGELHVGDVIFYDWNGDGGWQHTAVVVDFDPEGRPLVNAHTSASYHRLWDYRDSPAWSPETRYGLVHIRD